MDLYNRLREFNGERRRFDPGSKEDLKELAYFQKHKTWKTTCPFYLEWPHKDIVSMCQVFYTEHMLRNLAK
jgi:hypothetical protein